MNQTILIECQYLPPISSFVYILLARGVCLEMQENYQKRTYRNRCNLIGPNGQNTLSVPLRKGKNQQMCIKDVLISYEMPWVTNHLNTIRSNYGSAPYFDFIFQDIQSVLTSKPKFLYDLNIRLLFNIINFLGLDVSFSSSTNYTKFPNDNFFDIRNCIVPVTSRPEVSWNQKQYQQVFMEKNGFVKDLSILDILFCLGKESIPFIQSLYTENIKI